MSGAQHLVDSALRYEGQLRHAPTNLEFSSFDLIEGSVSNDFLLLFAEQFGTVPTEVKQDVLSRYDATKNKTQRDTEREQPLRMSCWDFCFLALKDAGLITAQQIDFICCIVYLKEQREKTADRALVEALYKQPIEQYPIVDESTEPQPGDLILYKRNTASRPWHAEICIADQKGVISLGCGPCRKMQCHLSFEKEDSSFAEKCYIIPFDEIASNVKNYIKENESVLEGARFPLFSEKKVENQLSRGYKKFLASQRETRKGSPPTVFQNEFSSKKTPDQPTSSSSGCSVL